MYIKIDSSDLCKWFDIEDPLFNKEDNENSFNSTYHIELKYKKGRNDYSYTLDFKIDFEKSDLCYTPSYKSIDKLSKWKSIENINTSSPLSAWLSSIEKEDDEEEE